MRIALIRHRFRKKRLSGSRSSEEKHALRRVYAEPFEKFRIPYWKLYHLAYLLYLVLQAAYVLVVHLTYLHERI